MVLEFFLLLRILDLSLLALVHQLTVLSKCRIWIGPGKDSASDWLKQNKLRKGLIYYSHKMQRNGNHENNLRLTREINATVKR